MLKISELLSNESTAPAGFVWKYGPIHYEPTKGQKIALGDAPYAEVVDVSKFEENFPGVILAALNGTSIKVSCQAVTRRMRVAVKGGAKAPTDVEERTAVLNALRGVKNRTTTVIERTVYAALDGSEHASLDEAKAASMAYLIDQGIDPEKARQIVTAAS